MTVAIYNASDSPARARRLASKRVVVAIGGNATYPPGMHGSAEEQFALIRQSCRHLVCMVEHGYQPVLTHGNGPVIGNILARMAATSSTIPPMPMDVCVAHSQGGIGYMIQQCLGSRLRAAGIDANVVAVVTQVEVDPNDDAFNEPTKPIGRFLCKEDADRLGRETGWRFIEDAGRGYRRVVSSPRPRRIIEVPTIRALLDAGVVPIAVGGGGVPVVAGRDGDWHGAAAVIDKDLASALLATELEAGTFLLLTGVDKVALDFGKPTERKIDRMSAAEARRHLADGQFPPGSMGPKIRAALQYLEATQGQVIITSLENAFTALEGSAGTRIEP